MIMVKRMNILIACDQNYIEPMKTMLYSLRCNTNGAIDVYLLYNRISEDNIQRFSTWLKENCSIQLKPIFVEESLFQNAPQKKWWSVETYFRLMVCSLLPIEIDRILWLDADIIVNRGIDDFYEQSFDENYAVVCKGCNQSLKKNLDLPSSYVYFNAGVILFNLKKLRSIFSQDLVFSYIDTYHDRLKALDQDILNIMFIGHVKYANELIYNHEIYGGYVTAHKQMVILRNQTAIIHFTGPIKPWNPEGANWADSFWWKYERKRGRAKEWLVYRILNLPMKLYYNFRELYFFVFAQMRKILQ